MLARRFSVLVLIVVLGGSCIESGPPGSEAGPSEGAADTARVRPAFDIRAVTVDARRPPEPTLLVRLAEMGVTHVTLVAFGWQRAADDPQVHVDTSGGWYSESHRGIRTLARQADTLGIDVVLKPHLWVGGYDEAISRSDIAFRRPAAWRRWARSYRDFLMVYARLAQDVDADLLVLGTELSQISTTRPDYWRGLADTVRTVYGGDLTYAANWHDEYREIDFWDALDYVGVQAYFPLTEQDNPSLDTLRARWRAHRRSLAAVQRRAGRPVLFTEIGYRSAPSAAAAPWRWPEQDGAVPSDTTLQARCYEAFLATMHDAPWFAGAIIWKWHPAHSGDRPTAFTPQDKPAEAVLRRWFRPTATTTGR
jgi:hypothetical protein